MAHSLLSPSGASRWLTCPASVALGQFEPESTSAFAQEGTAAHALAETVLYNRKNGLEDYTDMMLNETIEVEGEQITVDHEMVEMVGEYVERIWSEADTPDTVEFHVEQQVDFSRVIGVEEQGGTVDALIIKRKENGRYRLQIHDLKYGRGVRVEAEDNPQLMLYALGALDEWMLLYDIEDVEMAIHQVRLRSETSMIMTVAELEDFALNASAIAQEVYALAAAAMEQFKAGETVLIPADKFCPSEKACQFCKISPCEAQSRYAAHIISEEFKSLEEVTKDTIPLVGKATPETLSGWLNSLDLVEKFCDDVRKAALAQLSSGKPLPGYKLVRGRPGNRAWSNAEEAENLMKAMRLKRDDMYNIKVISPTDAEKLLKKEHSTQWSKLEPMITRAEGKLNVAPESDKAPAVIVNPANDFSNLE